MNTEAAHNLACNLERHYQRLRDARGLKWGEFAMELGISRPQLNLLSSGHANPKLDTIQRMADSLGVPPSDLISKP